jgi:uncharacterized membrane protein
MNYDVIVNIIAYDIIVNIIPVISGTLHYQGPWPAFAGQPYLSCIYIPIRSNCIITAMSISVCYWAAAFAWLGRRCTVYHKDQGSRSQGSGIKCTPLMMYGVLFFVLSKS